MLLVGIAFLVFAALVALLEASVVTSAVIVGAGLVVLALILGERTVR
jgi:hypothetical protein